MVNVKSEYQEPAPENTQETGESAENIRSIYRGVWAERLKNAQKLPVGGCVFGTELYIKIELDFATFDEQIEDFTEETIRELYEQSKDSVEDFMKNNGSDMDPYTYFLCYQVQNVVHKLLEVDPNAPTNWSERDKMYGRKKLPKLSEFLGKTACGERAALGQYLLQRAGAESAYVSGITMDNAKDTEEYPGNHSFLVLKHPGKPDATLIFDIARPLSQQHVPHVLETDVPFTYELLKDKGDLLVGAKEVLKGDKLWFGVGFPGRGVQNIIEASPI